MPHARAASVAPKHRSRRLSAAALGQPTRTNRNQWQPMAAAPGGANSRRSQVNLPKQRDNPGTLHPKRLTAKAWTGLLTNCRATLVDKQWPHKNSQDKETPNRCGRGANSRNGAVSWARCAGKLVMWSRLGHGRNSRIGAARAALGCRLRRRPGKVGRRQSASRGRHIRLGLARNTTLCDPRLRD